MHNYIKDVKKMVEIRKKYKYHSLSMPVYFIDEVKAHIKHRPHYRSVAEYALVAMQEMMKREKNVVYKCGFPPSQNSNPDTDRMLTAVQICIDNSNKKLEKRIKALEEKNE